MRKWSLLIILISRVGFKQCYANSTIPSQLSFCVGQVSSSFAENADKLTATDGTTSEPSTPYSGTASSMPLTISYEFFPNLKRSYFISGAGPILGSSPDRYYSAAFGINFYFGQVASQTVISDLNFEMKMIPKFRYYAGPAIGIGYLIYNTKSATKNDMLFEIGGQGGVLYSLNQKWGLKGEIGASRGIGALVSGTIIKIFLGTTYNLGF
jgi:hypothetical protein